MGVSAGLVLEFLTGGVFAGTVVKLGAAAGSAAGSTQVHVTMRNINRFINIDYERLSNDEKLKFVNALKILKEIKKFPNFYENEYLNYQIKQEFNLIFMTYQLIKKQISIKPEEKDITTKIPINIPEGRM